MNKEVKEIIDKYMNNIELRKFSNQYYPNYDYNEDTKSKEEINRMTIGIDASLNYYLQQEGLNNQEIEIMERKVAEYELIVSKIFLDSMNDKADYNAYELQRFIDSIYLYYEKLNNVYKIKRTTEPNIGYKF